MKYKLTHKKIILSCYLFLVIINLLINFNFNYLYFREILSFIFLMTVPGILLLLILKIQKTSFWENLVYSIGLSITFLMTAGLAINLILPLLHITDKPLSLNPLLISFDVILFIFGLIAYKRNRDLSFQIQLPKLDLLNKIFFFTPMVLPLLSILGATTLNNGGSNLITIITILLICIMTVLLGFMKYRIKNEIYPLSIFFISLSLLLMFSMRSTHILGFDIHHEYQLFQLTKNNHIWDIGFTPGDQFNACLSITILPTVLSIFMNLSNDEYLFKLFFQIIFAILPVIIYLFFNKLNRDEDGNIISFFTSIFYSYQLWFMLQMPGLIRQEIAFIFIGLALLTIFDSKQTRFKSTVLFAIFNISIIFSHYSSTYIWIIFLLLYYFLFKIYKVFKSNIKINPLVNFKIILLIILLTFSWNTIITKSTDNLLNVTKYITINTKNELFTNFGEYCKRSLVEGFQKISFSYKNGNIVDNIKNTYALSTKNFHQIYPTLDYYNYSQYSEYTPESRMPEDLHSNFNNSITGIVLNIFKIIKVALVVIFPFVGIYHLVKKYVNNDENYLHYTIYSIASFPLMFVMLFIPLSNLSYNVDRLYLQLLILLSGTTIIGLLSILKQNKSKYIITTILLSLFLIYQSGLVFQIFGGTPYINLNNIGDWYDKFWTYQQEIDSAKWLVNNYDKNSFVFDDQLSSLKLIAYTNFNKSKMDIYPSVFTKSSYIYLGTSNLLRNVAYNSFNNDSLRYNYPISFLNINKNLIYSNGGSEIYR